MSRRTSVRRFIPAFQSPRLQARVVYLAVVPEVVTRPGMSVVLDPDDEVEEIYELNNRVARPR